MKDSGYVAIPRSMEKMAGKNAAEKIRLLTHICFQVEYKVVEHPKYGEIEENAMFTSISQLSKGSQLSTDKVEGALNGLVADGYIKVETSKRGRKITVIWDDFVQLQERLRGNSIMLNTKASTKVNTKASTKASTLATVEDSASYNDCEKKVAKQVAKQVTNIVINNKENNNTHTENIYPVRDLKAQAQVHARDTHAHTYTSHTTHPQVEELVKWMSSNTPELLAMVKPFSDDDLRQMVEEHTMEELKTILREMWSNGVPWKKLSATVEFRKYARAHKQFRERFTTESQPVEKLYTYDDMADYVWKNRVPQDRYFQMVKHNGKMMYRKIC